MTLLSNTSADDLLSVGKTKIEQIYEVSNTPMPNAPVQNLAKQEQLVRKTSLVSKVFRRTLLIIRTISKIIFYVVILICFFFTAFFMGVALYFYRIRKEIPRTIGKSILHYPDKLRIINILKEITGAIQEMHNSQEGDNELNISIDTRNTDNEEVNNSSFNSLLSDMQYP
jgi:hypothetical protein